MFTFLLNLSFAFLTIFSLNSAFDGKTQNEQGNDLIPMELSKISENYLNNLRDLFVTLRSDEPALAERNTVVDSMVDQINTKLQEKATIFPDLGHKIGDFADFMSKENSLFSCEEQAAFASKLSEISAQNQVELASLKIPSRLTENVNLRPNNNI